MQNERAARVIPFPTKEEQRERVAERERTDPAALRAAWAELERKSEQVAERLTVRLTDRQRFAERQRAAEIERAARDLRERVSQREVSDDFEIVRS